MKKNILASLVMFSTVMAAGVNMAQAADGTIHFTGNITADACKVDSTSGDQTVAMGTVAATAFAAAGDKAAPTKFEIKLTDCPATVTQVSARFDGVPDPVNTKLLKLDADQTAVGVGLEIADINGSVIPFATASEPVAVDAGTGTADMQFVGRYVSTADSVTAGSANATSEFTVNYQ